MEKNPGEALCLSKCPPLTDERLYATRRPSPRYTKQF